MRQEVGNGELIGKNRDLKIIRMIKMKLCTIRPKSIKGSEGVGGDSSEIVGRSVHPEFYAEKNNY